MSELSEAPREVVLLATEQVHAHEIGRDALDLLNGVDLEVEIVSDLEPAIERETEADRRVVILSLRDYGQIDERWREDDRVRPVIFRITEGAWPAAADALGMLLEYSS